jgi:hypothetical protein
VTPRNTVYITTTRTVAGVSDMPQLSATSKAGAKDYIHKQAKQYADMGYHIAMNKSGTYLVAKFGGVTVEIGVGE